MGTGARCDPAAQAKVAGMLRGGTGGPVMLGTPLVHTGAGGQRRDFTFMSPESLRPSTFLLDLQRFIKKDSNWTHAHKNNSF